VHRIQLTICSHSEKRTAGKKNNPQIISHFPQFQISGGCNRVKRTEKASQKAKTEGKTFELSNMQEKTAVQRSRGKNNIQPNCTK
jgi:hypothetical protein